MFRRSMLAGAMLGLLSSPSPFGIGPGDLPGTYFNVDDAPPPADAPPADAPPADAGGGTVDWKARFEAADAELKTLSDAEQARKDADLSEAQREKKRADTAEADATAAKAELLKTKIGGAAGLPESAYEFITATDEAGITAQVEKLKTFAKPPAQGGTDTRPGSGHQQTIDEQIAAAEKARNPQLAISLKREKAFGKKG